MDRNGRDGTLALRVLVASAAAVGLVAVAFTILSVSRGEDPPRGGEIRVQRVVVGGDAGSADTGGGEGAQPATPPVEKAPVAEKPANRRPVSRERKGPSPAMVVSPRPGAKLEVHSEPGGETVGRLRDETEFGSPTVLLVRHRRPGWLGVSTPLVDNGEVGWIRADPRALLGGYVDYRITVDLSERRARLFRAGRLERSWPVTIGASGTETPTGSFAITDTFQGGLNPAYGCCALALTATQPNLPKDWVGGNRIAFHGSEGALGEAASTGCLRSPDFVLRDLVGKLPPGTPVVIHE